MPKLLSRLKDTAVRLVDPHRDHRIHEFADALQQRIARQRERFDLDRALTELGISKEDYPAVAEQVYRRFLEKAWSDNQITDTERKQLKWVADQLELLPESAGQLNQQIGKERFEHLLAAAMEDGVVDEEEASRLETVARGLNASVDRLVRGYFATEGERFLRSAFLSVTEDGRITEREWDGLVTTAERLGIRERELLQAIGPQARQFVEHVLADAKSDGRLDDHEERTLYALIDRLQLPTDFRRYVEAEIEQLRLFTQIEDGQLPTVEVSPEFELKAGEIPHFENAAIYAYTRQLKSGPKTDIHEGAAVITDDRLIFSSPTKSFTLPHKRVLKIIPGRDGIELRCETQRGAGTYQFPSRNQLAYAIYRTAVGKANQTIVENTDSSPTRHIPRDVRQRVWQRYGGHCAECGSDQYLEFDHVIPVAKGGSNSDQNIQLLCRGCNQKKSAHI